MYTHDEAVAVANAFRARNVEGAENVRVEERASGGWRAVYDTLIRCRKRASSKSVKVTRHLIAGWHREVPADVWAMIGTPLTDEQAAVVRAAVEPILPAGWRFGSRWFKQAAVWVVKPGKRTMVTMHCVEP
jgi:hypothetical protein